MYRMHFACKYQPRWFYSTVGWEGVHAALRGVLLQPVLGANPTPLNCCCCLLARAQKRSWEAGMRDLQPPGELLGRAGTSCTFNTFSRVIKAWGSWPC